MLFKLINTIITNLFIALCNYVYTMYVCVCIY